jgi:hypothetical protein
MLWLNECHYFRVTAPVSDFEICHRNIPGRKFPVSRRMDLLSKRKRTTGSVKCVVLYLSPPVRMPAWCLEIGHDLSLFNATWE